MSFLLGVASEREQYAKFLRVDPSAYEVVERVPFGDGRNVFGTADGNLLGGSVRRQKTLQELAQDAIAIIDKLPLSDPLIGHNGGPKIDDVAPFTSDEKRSLRVLLQRNIEDNKETNNLLPFKTELESWLIENFLKPYVQETAGKVAQVPFDPKMWMVGTMMFHHKKLLDVLTIMIEKM